MQEYATNDLERAFRAHEAHTHGFEKSGIHVHLPEQDVEHFVNFLKMQRQIRDHQVHMQLLDDLLEHMWIHDGNQGTMYFMFQLCTMNKFYV
jgi:hypothetical protein